MSQEPDKKFVNTYIQVLKSRHDALINDIVNKDTHIIILQERVKELEEKLKKLEGSKATNKKNTSD